MSEHGRRIDAPSERPRGASDAPSDRALAVPARPAADSARAVHQTPVAPLPGVLGPGALASLPFTIDLPAGVQLTSAGGNGQAGTWTIRKGPTILGMIYAGPQSQFPIYDGDQVSLTDRTSVVVSEGPRRIAMEHLFQRSMDPAEIHVWVMAPSGPDRDLAESIAQTLDPR